MSDRRAAAAHAEVATVDPESSAAIWALEQYFAYLDETFDTGFEPGDLAADLALFRPPDGAFVLATIDSETVACGGLQTIEPGIGEIKRMWVAAAWRGAGLGRRMVGELEAIATRMAHHTLRLDTNRALTPAITMYTRLGYRPIGRYNDNPYAHHWFEKPLG